MSLRKLVSLRMRLVLAMLLSSAMLHASAQQICGFRLVLGAGIGELERCGGRKDEPDSDE